jgi:hypothetical protein
MARSEGGEREREREGAGRARHGGSGEGVCPTLYGAGVPTERMKASANASHVVSMSGMGASSPTTASPPIPRTHRVSPVHAARSAKCRRTRPLAAMTADELITYLTPLIRGILLPGSS